jgi:broad specificity phosphatase PhoE
MIGRRGTGMALGLVLLWICLPAAASAQKLIFIVRHAERADDGAPLMQSQENPPLSESGQKRAAKLAELLRDAGIQAIYVTEYLRTQQTANPLAAKLGLKPVQIPQKNTMELIRKMIEQHEGDIILVVNHSSTIPGLIKTLGGPNISITDYEYDNLFIFAPASRTLTRIRFNP